MGATVSENTDSEPNALGGISNEEFTTDGIPSSTTSIPMSPEAQRIINTIADKEATAFNLLLPDKEATELFIKKSTEFFSSEGMKKAMLVMDTLKENKTPKP